MVIGDDIIAPYTMMQKRNSKGQFVRTRKIWDGSDWNDGYIAHGRMRIYRPDYPKQIYSLGYVERAHVIWWLANGEIPDGMVIHHRNKNTLDDRIENLQMMPNGEHIALHHRKERIKFICENCGKEFGLLPGRVRGRKKEGKPIRFCSRGCLGEGLKAPLMTKNCEQCGNRFEVSSGWGKRDRRFCTRSCATKWTWKNKGSRQ